MTPIWIDGYYDSKLDAWKASQENLPDGNQEGIPMQAVTLKQLEAWLKSYHIAIGPGPVTEALQLVMDTQNAVVDTLLAQVRAWKGGA